VHAGATAFSLDIKISDSCNISHKILDSQNVGRKFFESQNIVSKISDIRNVGKKIPAVQILVAKLQTLQFQKIMWTGVVLSFRKSNLKAVFNLPLRNNYIYVAIFTL
jgi:hypothetical protein